MDTIQEKQKSSYLFGGNADFIEGMYDKYLLDPSSVDECWKKYFDSLQDATRHDVSHTIIKQKFAILTQKPLLGGGTAGFNDAQAKVWRYIEAYRTFGMAYANLDPLQRSISSKPAELNLATYSLENELENEFYIDLDIQYSKKFKLQDIAKHFDLIYTKNVGFEFEHISDLAERAWLSAYVEDKYLNFKLNNAKRIQILEKLTQADGLERYLGTRYVGQKRFSLEGGDALIPALDRVIETGAKCGIQELYIGMAHRGRLNALVNIAGKSPQEIFDEFEYKVSSSDFVTSGDVKYHKGYKCNYITENGQVKVTIAYNPSHLETINPVLNGIVRANQDLSAKADSILGVIIHGDSALIGLGTNQGVLNMSLTRGYNVHGMLHIVINNQVGFTTSDVRDNRSSRFCTDIAKMIEAPIIHVNGDDLDSIAFVMDLAIDYRTKYKKDIMLDIVCFRRHGHNEADDPTLTQPYMYAQVKKHATTRKIYADKLIQDGVITQEFADSLVEDYRLGLTKGIHINAKNMLPLKWYDGFDTKLILSAKPNDKVTTYISSTQISIITEAVTTLPSPDFKLHPTVARLNEARKAMGKGDTLIDFGMAETLAYGSLLEQGISIRMSGEDSTRGTFTHRQAVWHDVTCDDLSDHGYTPLTKLENGSTLHLFDSVLNEECVLGFEYGYSTSQLRSLVIWEAQFGDFANGAQVIIDQFITSGEAKWGILSSVTLMLPHGYDGQGPEHSSARVERFLQLCAENNMQVAIPTTAAQMFHLLRHKALTNWVKPLVIFMSKRLLRYKGAMSPHLAFTNGGFETIIGDDTAKKANKVIVCTGQIYYDLYNERSKLQMENEVAIIRLEQLYPFPLEKLKKQLQLYTKVHKYLWVQEEPFNQGGWLQLRDGLNKALDSRSEFGMVSRSASAAPATGSSSVHATELAQILKSAFAKR